MLFLDFEFNEITSEKVNLVSCVTHDLETEETKKFWLHNSPDGKQKLVKHLKKYPLICGYACVAEARSFYSAGFNPLDFQWVDLFLEYRMLSNHNDKLNWGKQLVDGKVKTVHKPKPKWERTDNEAAGFKPTHSLAEATYKLTGEIRDTAEKDAIRKLIISNPKEFSAEERKKILDYNAADVEFLPIIWGRIKEVYKELMAKEESFDWEEYLEDAKWRGRYSAHTAIMESVGYPINYAATKNFSKQIPLILAECQRDINSQFKHTAVVNTVITRITGVSPLENPPFKWDGKKCKYSWNQKATRDWITRNANAKNWMKTDKGALSLSLEAFERQFAFKHDYPRGNFGAQMVRFLKLKQSLYGFSSDEGGKKKSFWNSVGPDKRVRPYMNIYGAQSGRSQPAATGFMFLKPAWMRALVEPAEGYYLAGIDYGQQEFFLAGLLSGDKYMIEAYLSGDPYLYMGKQAGLIPQHGTKKSHERERDLMKSTTLGILFGMTKIGLAAKLTADSGQEFNESDAQDFIDRFEQVYPRYIEWREEVRETYEAGFSINTIDGWRLWTDNSNPRSVLNVPVQGAGSSIMRKAVDLAVERGCKVIFTLHDAIYIEAKVGQEKHIAILRDAMRDAFTYYFSGTEYEETAGKIKLDPKAWGRCFPEKGEIKVGDLVVPVSSLYIDNRSLADYNRFSKYFSEPDYDHL